MRRYAICMVRTLRFLRVRGICTTFDCRLATATRRNDGTHNDNDSSNNNSKTG
eukprot:COSAG02_NODE_488_length_21256_cov_9.406579_10_plen_53_part_00